MRPTTRTGGDRSIAAIEALPSSGIAAPPRRPVVTARPPDLLASFRPLVTAVRWGTIALGLALAALDRDEARELLMFGAVLAAYAVLRTVSPLQYRADRVSSIVLVLAEVAITLLVVVSTGVWDSPYVFCLASAILAAGFARGFGFAIRTAGAAVIAAAIPYHLYVADARPAITVQWAAELLLIALIAGYARRLFGQVEERDLLARQANHLLAQLNEVAQTLPGSLDLEEALAALLDEVRDAAQPDFTAVLLRDDATQPWSVAAARGGRLALLLHDRELPSAARRAAADSRAAATTASEPDTLVASAGAGVYLPMLAGARLVGLVAVEGRAERLDAASRAELERIVGEAALTIDNARWFSKLRTVGADEERLRIARDLHDRVGQSLAFVSFELDRISRQATGQPVEPDLVRLREDVRQVVTEVRDTLYELRTTVSEEQDLSTTLAALVDRINDHADIDIVFRSDATARLPVRQERELLRIAQEAINNARRHASGTRIEVSWTCDSTRAVLEVNDDGKGLDGTGGRPDSYGILGMRERASAIGARFDVASPPEGGTTVRCEVDLR